MVCGVCTWFFQAASVDARSFRHWEDASALNVITGLAQYPRPRTRSCWWQAAAQPDSASGAGWWSLSLQCSWQWCGDASDCGSWHPAPEQWLGESYVGD